MRLRADLLARFQFVSLHIVGLVVEFHQVLDWDQFWLYLFP